MNTCFGTRVQLRFGSQKSSSNPSRNGIHMHQRPLPSTDLYHCILLRNIHPFIALSMCSRWGFVTFRRRKSLPVRNTEEKKVTRVVEQVLIDSSDNPHNAVEASVAAAIDENVDLDCVFFLLRRNLDVVQKLGEYIDRSSTGTTRSRRNHKRKRNLQSMPLIR